MTAGDSGTIAVSRLEARSLIALDMCAIETPTHELSALSRDINLECRLSSAGIIRDPETCTPRTWAMDRLERHTMGHRAVDQLPARAILATPLAQDVSRSSVKIANVILAAHGILVIEGRTDVDTTGGIGIADAVEELRVARRTVDTLAETVFREAAQVLCPDSGASATNIVRGLVEDRSGRFDIYDLDAHLTGNPSGGWAALLADRAALQELVGLIRLSRPGVWRNYGEKFCKGFIEEVDLGKRVDDLWAVYGRRLFRRHPEAVSRQDVQDYFDDVTIIGSVLLATEASLETVAERFAAFGPDILRRIGLGGRSTDEVNAALAEAVEVLPAALAPSRIHEHFGHPFFQSLSAGIESSLRLTVLRDSVRHQVVGFLGAASAVASNIISNASLRSARKVEGLTVATVILSVAVLAFTLLQFFNLFQRVTP